MIPVEPNEQSSQNKINGEHTSSDYQRINLSNQGGSVKSKRSEESNMSTSFPPRKKFASSTIVSIPELQSSENSVEMTDSDSSSDCSIHSVGNLKTKIGKMKKDDLKHPRSLEAKSASTSKHENQDLENHPSISTMAVSSSAYLSQKNDQSYQNINRKHTFFLIKGSIFLKGVIQKDLKI
ncbi:hypothetical protein CEXT_566561 [Caerostris extrusa]|uniref:Uncharacterized protein n=1 Tax=Caerostris extrusa TaxID=172846 RepID=A0AAV4S1L7_CAEEX|nr:hypothetical protein CEXT_566561 [Caerostris extrusa]